MQGPLVARTHLADKAPHLWTSKGQPEIVPQLRVLPDPNEGAVNDFSHILWDRHHGESPLHQRFAITNRHKFLALEREEKQPNDFAPRVPRTIFFQLSKLTFELFVDSTHQVVQQELSKYRLLSLNPQR